VDCEVPVLVKAGWWCIYSLSSWINFISGLQVASGRKEMSWI
jgi:hypothetical protein